MPNSFFINIGLHYTVKLCYNHLLTYSKLFTNFLIGTAMGMCRIEWRQVGLILTKIPVKMKCSPIFTRATHSVASCPSGCLSVCLSVTAGIVSKRKQLASWFLHHLIAHWYRSLERYDSSINSQGVTPSEGDLWEWGGIFCDFRTYKAPYLRNGARYDQIYYWTLIGNPIRAFDWYQDQRPWMTLSWPWAAITRFLPARRYATAGYLRFFRAHHENMNEHRPILSAAKMYAKDHSF